MKLEAAAPVGLKGTGAGAAGLLNAAMRSLNELVIGFSTTGGACLAADDGLFSDAGADGTSCSVRLELDGRVDGSGCGSRDVSWASGGAGADAADRSGKVVDEWSIDAASGGGILRGGRDGLEGTGGSYFSTKFLGKMPSWCRPSSLVYSPVYQSSSLASVTVIIWPLLKVRSSGSSET